MRLSITVSSSRRREPSWATGSPAMPWAGPRSRRSATGSRRWPRWTSATATSCSWSTRRYRGGRRARTLRRAGRRGGRRGAADLARRGGPRRRRGADRPSAPAHRPTLQARLTHAPAAVRRSERARSGVCGADAETFRPRRTTTRAWETTSDTACPCRSTGTPPASSDSRRRPASGTSSRPSSRSSAARRPTCPALADRHLDHQPVPPVGGRETAHPGVDRSSGIRPSRRPSPSPAPRLPVERRVVGSRRPAHGPADHGGAGWRDRG